MLPHVVDLFLVVFDLVQLILEAGRQRSRERVRDSEIERYGTSTQNKMM